MNSKLIYYFKEKNQLFIALSFLISWIFVAFGHPTWISGLGILSSFCGFSIFWLGLLKISSKKQRFFCALVWFMAVEAVHFSWMTATEYQGSYIYGLYLFILSALALQFAIVNLFLEPSDSLSFKKIGLICGSWVLMEWLRLFFMCGLPFNPVGLSLSTTLYSKQWTSVGGIYFLSFWVFLTNLMLLKALRQPFKSKNYLFPLIMALAPYFYGHYYLKYHDEQIKKSTNTFKALLVQTALNPEEKNGMNGFDRMIPPLDQWSYIFSYLSLYQNHKIDLIVLPEHTLPFGHNTPLYPKEYVEEVLSYYFGPQGKKYLENLDQDVLDHVFFSQFLADYFEAQVIIGLEKNEQIHEGDYTTYAGAFSFRPNQPYEVYYKRVLLPIVEYLPFQWCVDLAKKYYIEGWFQKGTEAKKFSGPLQVSASICIEELYGSLIRKNRLLGSHLFVNLTNDVWFPNSRLPKQHYDHGLLRAIENGVPLLRACNTGVTVAVDSLGRERASFHTDLKKSQWKKGALYVEMPLYNHKTLYLYLGDNFIVMTSVLLVGYGILVRKRKPAMV